MLGGPSRTAPSRAPRRRCAVIAAQPAIRTGVVATLLGAAEVDVVVSSDAVEGVLGHGCDVALLDLWLVDGSTPTRNTLRLRADGTRVLGFGSGADPVRIRDAARAGSHGMVRASEPAAVLAAAVRTVLRGDVAASTDWAAAVDADPDVPRRSALEARVLELVAAGARSECVAVDLGITPDELRAALRAVRAAYVRPAWRDADRFS